MADNDLINLLYDPASYAHASHFPQFFQPPAAKNRIILNFWLLKKGKLEDLAKGELASDPLLSLLLAHWYQLYDAAYLIGSFLCREQLLKQSETLMANPRLLAFICLPLRYQTIQCSAQPDNNPTAWGAAFILEHYPALPAALRQRMRLIFPAKMSFPRLQAPRSLDNSNLLRVAFSYACYQK